MLPISVMVENHSVNELPDVVVNNLLIDVGHIPGTGHVSYQYRFRSLLELHLECYYLAVTSELKRSKLTTATVWK